MEGGPGLLSVDQSTTLSVFVLGPGVPREGDDLICRFVGHRWVAEKMTGSRPSTVDLGNCLCEFVPAVLTMYSADTSSDGGMFQDCTLSYGPTPAEFAPLSLGDECFLSNQSFVEAQSGYPFRYYFYCTSRGSTSPASSSTRRATLRSWTSSAIRGRSTHRATPAPPSCSAEARSSRAEIPVPW